MDSFLQWQIENWKDDNFFPPELEPQRAIHMLTDYLLGDNWYFADPVNAKQGNVLYPARNPYEILAKI